MRGVCFISRFSVCVQDKLFLSPLLFLYRIINRNRIPVYLSRSLNTTGSPISISHLLHCVKIPFLFCENCVARVFTYMFSLRSSVTLESKLSARGYTFLTAPFWPSYQKLHTRLYDPKLHTNNFIPATSNQKTSYQDLVKAA